MILETIYVISVLLSYEGGAQHAYNTLDEYPSLEVCEIAMKETDKALEAKVGKNDGRGVITGYTITCEPKSE